MDKTPNQPFDPFYTIARKLRPDLDTFSSETRILRVTDVLGTLVTIPASVAGLIWLALVTQWNLFFQNWLIFLSIAIVLFSLGRLRAYLITDLGSQKSGTFYGNAAITLDGLVKWSAIFIFGPTIIWLDVILGMIQSIPFGHSLKPLDVRWNIAREMGTSIAQSSLLVLISLSFYRLGGGVFPLAGLSWQPLLLGSGVIAIQVILETILVAATYLGFSLWAIRAILTPQMFSNIAKLTLFSILVPHIANLFAIPLAGIYVQNGPIFYFLFVAAVVIVALLTRLMSQATENSRQQSAQLEKLEALGRAILNAPPDASTLPDILVEHVPAMFTMAGLAIWIDLEHTLVKWPAEWDGAHLAPARAWLAEQTQARGFTAKERLSWQADPGSHRPLIVAPILDSEDSHPIGGIYIELISLGQPLHTKAIARLLPSLQSLAAQVASALHQAKVFEQTIAHQKTMQELAVARQIQISFLPRDLPRIPGWQIAASLEPAREMAGDFYDLIPLSSGKLGILVADVADKGVGPALYMALSRTLIRTFATQYETQPEKVLQAANQRILQDAGDGMFVTVFYGVLDPQTGNFVYANAGHNPPWVFHTEHPEPILLRNTGMALGADETVTWRQSTVKLEPGSVIFLYTDGATDAMNIQEEFFGEENLLQCVQSCLHQSAQKIQQTSVAAIRNFIGSAPQFDDITLVVVKRD